MMWRLALVSVFLSACTVLKVLEGDPNKRTLKDVELSITTIRAVLASQLPVGQKSMSSNGREFFSKLFVPAGDGFKPGDQADDRYTAHFTILGDRRPYEIEVAVLHEKRVLRGIQFVYAEAGYDGRLAQNLADRIDRELTKRREQRNVIDDFRVY